MIKNDFTKDFYNLSQVSAWTVIDTPEAGWLV